MGTTRVCGKGVRAAALRLALPLALGVALALAGTVPAAGQQAEGEARRPAAEAPMELPRLTGPVELDGRLDEEAWRGVPPLPLTQYLPVFRGEPRERSEIRVAYDDEYLYAAGRFFDSDPDGIRVHSLYRDRWNGDDAFAIYVDAFNDNTSAKWFGTTPAGIRFDLLVSDDGAVLNQSWDAFWDVATRVTEEGWFAEVRIPFSSLGFQTVDRETVMGLTVTRLVSRTGERVTFPAIDPQFQFRQPSVARDVVLRGVESDAPLYLTPYALTGVERAPVPADGGGFVHERTVPREVGGDLRYRPSGTFTVDLTVNTDFAQVEADDEQVNLDRFSLFFPEKRRFFQEGSDVFDLRLGGGTRLFHSRRIGLDAARRPVPVLGGARAVGRVGEWDVGVLDMQTEARGASPSENFGVARLRRRVFNPYSTVGLMATTRVSDGAHNVAVGADGFFRLFGDTYLTATWAGTFDEAHDRTVDLWDRSHLHARLQRRVGRGLAYTLTWSRQNRAFEPDVGFLRRTDFTEANVLANWYFFTEEHSWLRRIWPGMLAFSTFRNGDGSLESGQYAVWVQWETRSGGGGWLEPKLFVEDVREPFRIGEEVVIPAGRHRYADFQAVLTMPAGKSLRADIDARAGTFFDGTRAQLVAGPTWNASPHLELGADYQYTRLRFDDRDQAADIHLARVRVRSALDARLSGNAFLQYNSTTDRVDLNVRLRYNFAEGTDLWLVYDEGLSTERGRDAAGLPGPRSLSRTLLLKYSYTFGG